MNLTREDIINILSSNDNSNDITLKHNAIFAASEYIDAEIIALIEKLCVTSDPTTRYFAKKSLKKIREKIEKNNEQNNNNNNNIKIEINDTLFEKLINEKDVNKKQNIFKILYQQFDVKYLPKILTLLQNEKDPFIIATLVKIIGKYGGEQYIDKLLPYLNHEDLRVKANTIEALELIGTEKIIPYILPFVNDNDNRIKANAVKALSKFKANEMLEVLKSMANSKQLWMQNSAIFALAQLKTDEAVDILYKLTKSDDKSISNNAINALNQINSNYALSKVKEINSNNQKNIISNQENISFNNQQPKETISLKNAIDPSVQQTKKNIISEVTYVKLKSKEEEKEATIFEKLKSTIDKKSVPLINIYDDNNEFSLMNLNTNLDDDFFSYVSEIKYISLSTINQSKNINTKKEINNNLENNKNLNKKNKK